MFARISAGLKLFAVTVLVLLGAMVPAAAAPPTATIVVHNDMLGIGATSLVTFTFSEAVTGFTLSDLTADNGSLSSLSTSDNIVYTATLVPVAGITDTSNRIVLDNTGVVNGDLTPGVGTTSSNNYVVDATPPVVTIVVAERDLKAGQTSLVTFTFSEAVTGFDNNDLQVPNGTTSTVTSADGGFTWTATYAPNDGVSDSSNLISINNTGYSDLAGNAGVGTTNSANFTINTVRPTATIVVSTSPLGVGITSLVTITFSEAVSGFTNGDLTIENGALSAVSSSDGGVTWMATFSPTASIENSGNKIRLDNSGVTNAAGNSGAGVSESNNYAIDTLRPTASVVVAQTVLQPGDTSTVIFSFSEAVTGFTTADVTAENASITNLSSSDGGVTWTGTLNPAAGIANASNVLVLDLAGVSDLAGNSGSGSAQSNAYSINVPALSPASGALPGAIAGVAYSQTFSATGGLGGYSFAISSGGLPAGLSLSTGGGLSGTPTQAGSFSFAITLSAAGGYSSAPYAYTLEVSGAAPVAQDVTANVPYGSNSTPISLQIVGDGVSGVAVVTAPAHGTTAIAGLSILYTPVTGYFGTDSFTYTATNASGTSAPARVSITVAPPGAPVVQPVSAAVDYGSRDNPIALQIAGDGVTGVVVLTAPAHGTTAVDGLAIRYTPAAGYAGADSFTYAAVNPGGTSAPALVSITVAAPTLAIGPDVLPNSVLGQSYGQGFAASGGLAPYAFAVADGALPPGLSLSGSGALSGVPTGIGAYAFTIAATDAGGQTASRAYSLTIEEDVAAVRERFDELGQSFVETRIGLLNSGIETPGLRSRSELSGRPGTVTANTSGNSQVLGFATSLAEISAAGGAAEALAEGGAAKLPFNVWLDTRLTLHARTDETDYWGDFALAALGADYLFADNVLVGMALYGDWMSEFSDDSSVKGKGFLTGPYVSIGLGQGVTFDANLFYGQSSNDISAQVLGLDYAGRFETDRILLKAKLEGTWNADLLTIRPNATFFLMNERAGDYAVSTPGGMSIAVPGFEKTDYRIGLGASFEYAYLLDNGMQLTPQLGLSLASGNGGASDGGLFSQAYGKLSAGLVLTDQAWRLSGKVDLDISTSNERAISASGSFRLAF